MRPASFTLTPSTLPSEPHGARFSITLIAGGGIAPFKYKVTAGALPKGVTLNGKGVPGGLAAAGVYPFSVIVTDKAKITIAQSYVLTVT